MVENFKQKGNCVGDDCDVTFSSSKNVDNKEKYKSIFIESLAIDRSKFNENIKYNEIPEWDSIGQMTLMSGLEEGFKISMETDDIVDFSSFTKGHEILKKYKIEF